MGLAEAAAELAAGTLLDDRFEVIALAGVGGMGAVYRALDRATGQPIAIKVMREDGGGDRFLREVSVLADLAHPVIVRYVAHGRDAGGRLYLAMEWLDGEDLGKRLERGALPDADALALAGAVASALGAAHAVGVVHRDVKPSNIFLVDGDPRRPRLLDFGVARPISAEALTLTGVLIGTPHYMSPEQAGGELGLDARSDVYALGCVVFEMLTGQRMRTGTEVLTVLAQALLDDAPRLAEIRPVDRTLDALVARMLARERTARPIDGTALALELASVSAGTAPFSEVIGGGERRLRSAVVVALDTLTSTDLHALRSAIEPLMIEAGARVAAIRNDVMIAALPQVGLPQDQAARAARLALDLRKVAPATRIGVLTKRGVLATGSVALDLVGGALAAVDATPFPIATRPDISIDAMTISLVGPRFVIERSQDRMMLARERLEPRDYQVLGHDVPCVGREQELARLDGALAECLTESLARAIVITGEPGLGKSRLVDEFVTRARVKHPDLRTLIVRARAEQAGTPFGVVASLARQLVGDSVRPPRTAAFLGELLGTPYPDDFDPALPAARRDAQIMLDLTRQAWRELVAETVAQSDLLVVLEDLHWADLTSLALVELVLRELAARPILVIATARPELATAFPDLWASVAPLALPLSPLSGRAAERLVRAALGDTGTPEHVTQIVNRAAGNPLYLEELARAGGSELPVSILAAVQARLDAAGPEGRRVLRAASVYGEQFQPAGITAITSTDPAATLADLVTRELVSPGYRFRHAVFREAAYELWLPDDLRTAHRLAAGWLEATGERNPIVLADHHRKGGMPERAAGYLVIAAEQALRGGDLAAALRWAGDALPLAIDPVVRGKLRLVAAEAHYFRGEMAAAATITEELIANEPAGSDAWSRATALAVSAGGQAGANDRVRAILDAVIAAPHRTSRTAETLARGISQLALAGNAALVAPAIAALDGMRAEPLDSQARHWIHRADGARAFLRQDVETAIEQALAALACAEETGDLRGAVFQLIAMTSMHVALGELDIAAVQARRARTGAERIGAGYLVTWARLVCGKAAAARGSLDDARPELEYVIAQAGQSPRMLTGARMWLAYVATAAGAFELAIEQATAALALAALVPARAAALGLLSRAHLGAGDREAALAAAIEANALADSVPNVEEFQVVVRLAHVEALLACSRTDDARPLAQALRDHLLARAERITDLARRDAFLAHRAEHAAALRLARQLS
ncbi:MAG: protein kinase [Kofleriaceae bacterium]